MNRLCIFLIAILLGISTWAAPSMKVQADSAYAKEDYQKAASLYEQVLKGGHSSEIYYNLGNCYYRMEKVGSSVLNYERALLLNPGDAQIRHNLELARNKTADKITPVGEIFIVTWYKTVINWLSVDQWSVVALGSFILLLLMLALYLFGKSLNFRKTGFYSSLVLLLVCVISNIFAWNQKHILLRKNTAVVMSAAASVKSTPSQSGTDLFVLHEGTKVTITDATMKGWKEIRLDDGKNGWISAENIENI